MLRRKLFEREQTPRWPSAARPRGAVTALRGVVDVTASQGFSDSTSGVWGAYTRFLKLPHISVFIFTSDRSVFINKLIIATQGQIRYVFLMPRQLIVLLHSAFYFLKSKGLSTCLCPPVSIHTEKMLARLSAVLLVWFGHLAIMWLLRIDTYYEIPFTHFFVNGIPDTIQCFLDM